MNRIAHFSPAVRRAACCLLASLAAGCHSEPPVNPLADLDDSNFHEIQHIVQSGVLVELAYDDFEHDGYDHARHFPEGFEFLHRIHGDDHDAERELYGFWARSRRHEDLHIVALRGTDDGAEWRENLKLNKADPEWLPGKVEKGFWQIYRSLTIVGSRERLADTIRGSDGKSWVIVGHSLGAALATVLAADLLNDPGRIEDSASSIILITLASPRVGNGEFADFVHQGLDDSYRIVNQSDIVPKVPGTWLGYRHVGPAYGFNSRNDPNFKPTLVCDHDLETYLAELSPESCRLAAHCRHSGDPSGQAGCKRRGPD
jgi:hypothetical protein